LETETTSPRTVAKKKQSRKTLSAQEHGCVK
jgi:hypothetical protein